MTSSLRLTSTMVAMVAATTFACDRRPTEEKPQETQTTGAKQPTTEVSEVKDDPARFYGKRVTLTGEVEKLGEGGRSFKLEGNDWLFGDEIRVLTRQSVSMGGAPLADDDDVVVTGTVRRFVVAEVERDLGWDIGSEVEIDLKDRPVLVADEIRRVEPAARWTADKPKGEIVGAVLLMTTATPESLVGHDIRIEGSKVQSVSGKGVWIGPTHAEQTFVLPTGGADISKLKAGDQIDVRGTVKKTPAAAEAVKSWDLPATMRNVVEGEPVYVEATEIKPATKAKTGKPKDPKDKPKDEPKNEKKM